VSGVVTPASSVEEEGKEEGALAQPAKRAEKAVAATSRTKDPTIKILANAQAAATVEDDDNAAGLKAPLEESFEFDQLEF
jgi:hypothetical protein